MQEVGGQRSSSPPDPMPKNVAGQPHPQVNVATLLLAFVLIGHVFVLLRTAWQCDDAFITFRTAANFLDGHGLVWNPGERVQSFTSPAWLIVSIVSMSLFGEPYFSIIAVSIALTLLSLLLLAHLSSSSNIWCIVSLAALSTSAAAVDYSTSGLENPALSLVLLVFVAGTLRDISPRSFWLYLIAALVALTRLDAVLIVLPTLCMVLWTHRQSPRQIALMGLGLTPLVAWEVFSLVYYGAVFPNTAYAKLNVEIPRLELMSQGLLYLLDTLKYDPISMVLIALGIVIGLVRRSAPQVLIAIGMLLYLTYLVSIGGDFMSGRFLSALCYLAVALFLSGTKTSHAPVSATRESRLQIAMALVVISYGIWFPMSRWRSGSDYGTDRGYQGSVRTTGIADERAYYYPQTGLMPVLLRIEQIKANGLPVPPYSGAVDGQRLAKTDLSHFLAGEVGFFGYFAGPSKYLIDSWALSDPFLARIPYEKTADWRIGHFTRSLPEGYLESRLYGENRLQDPELAELFDSVITVTRGELFSKERWREIWRYNTGYGDSERTE